MRHAYVIPVPAEDQAQGLIRQGAAKALYVSPFMGMDMDYRFRGHTPGERLDMAIDGLDADGVLITAAMAAEREPLDDHRIAAATASIPLMTLKVIIAIHWEALKLWLKGVALTRQLEPVGTPVKPRRRR